VEETHAPHGRFTPFRELAILVPDSDFPPTLLAQFERPTSADDTRTLIGNDSPRVPKVTVPGTQRAHRRGDKKLERRLSGAALAMESRLQFPTEPGARTVDTKRALEVLANGGRPGATWIRPVAIARITSQR
jgi:hypothetical protein